MKKPFFHRRNTLIRFRISYFSAGVLVLGVLLVLMRVAMPATLLTVASPLFHVGNTLTASVQNVTNSFGNVSTLARERTRLLAQNDALVRENGTLRARVEDLTALIGTTTSSMRGVVANILTRPPESPYDTLILGAQGNTSVTVGDYVLVQGGTPIGKIVNVSSNFYRAELFSSPLATTTAWLGTKRIPLTLVGEGSGAFRARIPRQEKVLVGDKVFVPGPASMHFIGVVARIDNDPTATMVTLRIRPLVNIFSLTTVDIVPR